MSLGLEKTSFVNDQILENFIHTDTISSRIDTFFSKVKVYKKKGIEVPKRAILLYGPPGTGKTTTIAKVCRSYAESGKTAIVIWSTDKHDPYDIKEFIKSFVYEKVERLILVIEDIGGVEMDQVRLKSDPSLLSLLDNQEKTFKIPTLILATTNFPEVFLGNLTNRPNRIDDKIEVGYPPAKFRSALLKFYGKDDPITKEDLELVESKKCEEFSPAHIREITIRSAVFDRSIKDVINEMVEEIQTFKKAFSKQKSMGFNQ